MNLNTTEQNILLSKEAILSMEISDIKNELNDKGKESLIILSAIVLASRAVMSKHRDSLFLKKLYDEKTTSSFLQDGKAIDEKTISLSTDSLDFLVWLKN